MLQPLGSGLDGNNFVTYSQLCLDSFILSMNKNIILKIYFSIVSGSFFLNLNILFEELKKKIIVTKKIKIKSAVGGSEGFQSLFDLRLVPFSW